MGHFSQADVDGEINDRSRCGQQEPARGSDECAALLDHHIEEVLNALNELTDMNG